MKISEISIHALLAESDLIQDYNARVGAHFYPRSPCGERLHEALHGRWLLPISIHALLAESDVSLTRYHAVGVLFLSTLSLRRATCQRLRMQSSVRPFLSTLSLRRATFDNITLRGCAANFYPRSPCGERPILAEENIESYDISIHALLAESDLSQDYTERPTDISIHALLAESDGCILTRRPGGP